MYEEVGTAQFKKDVKKLKKQHRDLNKLSTVIEMLKNGQTLDIEYKDHVLLGEYKNCRECHIEPDWLLIYVINKNKSILYTLRTGSHSELFKEDIIINISELNKQLNEILNDIE